MDPTRALVTLREGEELPAICSGCGIATKRTVAIRRRRTDEREPDNGAVVVLIGLVSLVAGVLALRLRRRSGTGIALHLPQCSACATLQGKPDPQHIAWNTHEATFEVSKDFRRSVRALRLRRAAGEHASGRG